MSSPIGRYQPQSGESDYDQEDPEQYNNQDLFIKKHKKKRSMSFMIFVEL